MSLTDLCVTVTTLSQNGIVESSNNMSDDTASNDDGIGSEAKMSSCSSKSSAADGIMLKQTMKRMLPCISEWVTDHGTDISQTTVTPLLGMLASLADCFPAFAPMLLEGRHGEGLKNIFITILSHYQSGESVDLENFPALRSNTARLLGCMLSTATNVSKTAQKLLDCSAIKCCVMMLRATACGNRKITKNGNNRSTINNDGTKSPVNKMCNDTTVAITRLLRVLRTCCTVGVSSHADSKSGFKTEADESANPFVTAIVQYRGLEALDLLRYIDCMQLPLYEDNINNGDGNNGGGENAGTVADAIKELTQLHALLSDSKSKSKPVTQETVQRTMKELNAYISLEHNGDWQAAFDAYIACELDEVGYPSKLTYCEKTSKWVPIPKPMRPTAKNSNNISSSSTNTSYVDQSIYDHGESPSPAALRVLQARARERILLCAQQKLGFTDSIQQSETDVVASLQFRGMKLNEVINYTMVIWLNDKKYPSHAAHFRMAAMSTALGRSVHTCFVPKGHAGASLDSSSTAAAAGASADDLALPYVSLYNSLGKSQCRVTPLALPYNDIIYGEYNSFTAAAVTAKDFKQDTSDKRSKATVAAYNDDNDDEGDATRFADKALHIDSGVIYPVGTVLMYPRSVIPTCDDRDRDDDGEFAQEARRPSTLTQDILWFIVFKPCPARLLRGAVPVGRVKSCIAGEEPSKHDSKENPFDSVALTHFETQHCDGQTRRGFTLSHYQVKSQLFSIFQFLNRRSGRIVHILDPY